MEYRKEFSPAGDMTGFLSERARGRGAIGFAVRAWLLKRTDTKQLKQYKYSV